jgi:flagellar hook assembly protein FlgD
MANPVVQPPAKPAQENSSGVVSSAAISKTQVIAVKSSLPEPVVIELNVFNPDMGQAMHIKYEVKKSTMVTVIIFNLKGEPVANLVRTQKEPGVYEEKWSGRGDSGVAVPSGKYIIYIKTDQTEQKIKAAIIK